MLGAQDEIALPPESTEIDYEGELAVVIGCPGLRIAEADALDHVLGYTVVNDLTMRDTSTRRISGCRRGMPPPRSGRRS